MSSHRLTISGKTRTSRGGKRDDLGGCYFRSTWEANWARYLNWLAGRGEISHWDYECDTFTFETIKRGTRHYTPDFKVFTGDEFIYHEVKGWMDPTSATKLKRMKKHYPGVVVEVIGPTRYHAVASKMRHLIKEWE